MSEIYSEISANEREPGEYFFKFQFFVHQVALTKDFFNITKPAVAIRFLDFPTMVIHGKYPPFLNPVLRVSHPTPLLCR